MTPGVHYARLSNDARLKSDRKWDIALRNCLRIYPYPRLLFASRLAVACREAEAAGGFYLGGFAAQRALGAKLVIDIDPSQLHEFLDERTLVDGKARNITDRFIGGGDWLPLIVPLETSFTHQEVFQLARTPDLKYMKIKQFKRARNRCKNDRPITRNFVTLDTMEKVHGYFSYLVELIKSVEANSVVRRRSFSLAIDQIRKRRDIRLPWAEMFESDIGVAIAADGRLLRFASGKHRTAAAQGLGIPSIPVEVRMVHCAWLNGQMKRTGLPAQDALLDGLRLFALAPDNTQSPST